MVGHFFISPNLLKFPLYLIPHAIHMDPMGGSLAQPDPFFLRTARRRSAGKKGLAKLTTYSHTKFG